MQPKRHTTGRTLTALALALAAATATTPARHATAAAGDDWAHYLGDPASSQFSSLTQITPDNVATLQPAWHHRTGDARDDDRSQIQCNPLVVRGTLYATSPGLKLFALDAATGTPLWTFDPAAHGRPPAGVNRGLVHWQDPLDPHHARILYASGHWLHAVDAATGQPVPSFGQDGAVDLKKDLGRDVSDLSLNVTTPGVLHGDLLITGMRLGEGPAPAAPGHIRAYHARTGDLAWRFNTIPQPGEFGYDTWPPEAYRHIGGANVWTGFALDRERGIVYCPTGAAAFDFWGGDRIGQNLFANCLVALDANTGKRLWHYQIVHHDLWDRDLPAPPNLVTLTRDGKLVDAVAQVTKSGHVFVFDRVTGTPLFPIQETPVPPSDLQGESAWPTQPLPATPAPFARQVFDYSQITDISDASHRAVLDRFVTLKPHTPFAPPSTTGTIIFPGFDGGAEWGGAAATPDGTLVVNANEMPWVLTMVETTGPGPATTSTGHAVYTQVCAACHGTGRQGNPAHGVPPLEGLGTRLKKPDILAVLETGKGTMPSFAFLTEPQKNAVASFLLGEEPPPSGTGTAAAPIGTAPYSHTGYNRWLDPDGYPAVKPPWGTLNAIDLNSGRHLWSVPLGEFPELAARGVPKTGTENYGGPVVTASGLVFIAASKDGHIRAFDLADGSELWKHELPAGGYATPAVYRTNGRQFVVIACGGGKMGTPSGDSYLAFALPE